MAGWLAGRLVGLLVGFPDTQNLQFLTMSSILAMLFFDDVFSDLGYSLKIRWLLVGATRIKQLPLKVPHRNSHKNFMPVLYFNITVRWITLWNGPLWLLP